MTEAYTMPSQEPMLVAVARGIQAFANLEGVLSICFCSMMEPGSRETAFRALDAARHFETKMRIADAVALSSLKGDLLKKWRSASNRLRRRASVRHKLAHWTVSYWPGASTGADIRAMKVALVPSMASSLHMPMMWGAKGDIDEQPLLLAGVEEFASQCNSLFMDLVKLSNAIDAAKRNAEDPRQHVGTDFSRDEVGPGEGDADSG